jgi:hypothetical protein
MKNPKNNKSFNKNEKNEKKKFIKKKKNLILQK